MCMLSCLVTKTGDDIVDAENMLATLTAAPWEEGFNSTYEYIVNNPYASTWMRSDAALLVVFVSDEEEQSNYEYPAVSDFLGWYQSQRMGSVFIASIVNLEASEKKHLQEFLAKWNRAPI